MDPYKYGRTFKTANPFVLDDKDSAIPILI